MASLIPGPAPCASTGDAEKVAAHNASEAVFKTLQANLYMENFS